MYLIGRIKNILEVQEFKNNFKKKSIILITDEQYPQNIIIDFIQDKIDLLNYININDKVKVYINIKGREWINRDGSTKYFNSIQAWKIEKVQDSKWDNSNYNNINDYDDDEDYENDENEDDDDEDDDDEDDDDEDDDDEDDDDEDDHKNKKKNKKNLPF
ncbi:MAG: DUF3127 domain-containing protein [Candidatus Shikimatogenerans bostrichidophilus]|nr:MAG: DUF3127 domain-containing protein [Candidatus Shikimatogenerans bostrichidophilus]